MNAEQFEGNWMQLKGELQQQFGKFTQDDLQQIETDYEKFLRKARERYGDKTDEILEWADQWHERSHLAAIEPRKALEGIMSAEQF